MAAEQFPGKPLRWISPFAPGGGADLTTRIVAQKMSDTLGLPVVVDTRSGASGNIGAMLAVNAPADGYTLLTVTASIVTNHAVNPVQNYDLMRDLAPVAQLTTQPYLLIVNPAVSAASVKELIGLARARPGLLNYGSSGVGSLQHLAGALLGARTKTALVHVPYKGGGPALTDLLGGQLQLFFAVLLSAKPFIDNGKVRALAVTSSRRLPAMPELPTMSEAGVSGYLVDNWYGVAVPAKTARHIVARLNAEIAAALSAAQVRDNLVQSGSLPVGDSASAFGAVMDRDLKLWRAIVKEAGIKSNE